MITFFQQIFDTTDFPPRWQCGEWTAGHGWLHILSDLAIFGAYAAIPLSLTYFIRRRTDVPFVPLFWLFAGFIISCGLVHLIEATVFWHPWYRLSGVFKAVTAVVSWITVVALIKAIPGALALPGMAKLNQQLQEEIVERKQFELELRKREANYRMLFEAPGVGRFEADASSSKLIRVNKAFCDLLGYTEEELLDGKAYIDFTHHDDREGNVRKIAQVVSGSCDSVAMEQRYLCKDRSCKWMVVHVSAVPFEEDKPERLVASLIDITSRKQSEERSRMFESAIRTMNDVVIITEAEPIEPPGPRIVYVNPAFTKETGYTEEEALGKTPRMLQGPKTDRATLDSVKEHLKARRPVEVELTNYRKDRSEFEVEFGIVPVANEDGQFTHCVSVQRDVTERKRTEEILRHNATLFSEIIDQAPGGVYVVDAQFRLQQVNDIAMPVFASVDPLIGKDFDEVMTILWGPEVGKQCADIFQNTLQTGESYVSPRFTEYRQDIGEEQSFEWEAKRITLPDGQYGVVCYFEDVTERIKAEEERRANAQRMRLATEATQVGIWEWHIESGLLRWDTQLFRIYGFDPTPDGIVQYSDWSSTVLLEDLTDNEAILQETIRTCGQSEREFRIRRRSDGQRRVIRGVETVRTNAEGRAEWVVGTNLDITDQKQAEETILNEARRKDEFLAMLGHELRNPLNAIRHAVEIASESPNDAEANAWASTVIDRQSQQLSRMVDDLLDVSRISRGRIQLQETCCDLGEVLRRAVSVVRSLLAAQRHHLDLEIGKELPVRGDAARLEQVFVNLLTNAAKYTPEGGRIRVQATPSGEKAIVVVADNGVGISADLLPHVCDLFRQADSTLDRAQGGLGIGMSVVQSLVQMHHGEIRVESDGIYHGTTVTVQLPLLTKAQPTQLSLTESEVSPAILSVDNSSKSLRVLIVDDHEDAAQGLARLLERRACEVRIAYTGPAGLEAALTFEPEVFLLDLGLPGYDGYELISRLKAEPAFTDAYFIAISGYAQDGDHDRCLAAGFNEHLSKPLSFRHLLKLISTQFLP